MSFGVSYAWLIETKNVNLDKVNLEGSTEEEMKMLPRDGANPPEQTQTNNNAEA